MRNNDTKQARRRFLKVAVASSAAAWPPLLSADDQRAQPRSRRYSADVVIIGSGPAGLSLADRLSQANISVAVIESGVERPTLHHQRLNQVGGARILENDLGLGRAGVRAIGGTTHVWGGVAPRLDASDFTSGTDYGYGFDWPIDLPLLERYYCQAESWLAASSSMCGASGATPFVQSSAALIQALADRGVSRAQPAGMSVDQQGLPRPINLAESAVKKLLRRQSFQLLKNTTARRLDLDAAGTVKGVVCTSNERENYVKGEVVVLAGGAIQNARLLLLSQNNQFKDGVGNQEGHVGAWFMDHPNLQLWLKPKRKYLTEQHAATYVHSYHLYRAMKRRELGASLLRFGVYQSDWQDQLGVSALPESNRANGPEHVFMLEALCEQEPQNTNRLVIDPDNFDRYGDPLLTLSFNQSARDVATVDHAKRYLEELAEHVGSDTVDRPPRLSSHHLMGTTRMSASDRAGVVDSNHKVFGTRNLYISGASVFPTGGAANPTLTLTALSLRLADHLRSF